MQDFIDSFPQLLMIVSVRSDKVGEVALLALSRSLRYLFVAVLSLERASEE